MSLYKFIYILYMYICIYIYIYRLYRVRWGTVFLFNGQAGTTNYKLIQCHDCFWMLLTLFFRLDTLISGLTIFFSFCCLQDRVFSSRVVHCRLHQPTWIQPVAGCHFYGGDETYFNGWGGSMIKNYALSVIVSRNFSMSQPHFRFCC